MTSRTQQLKFKQKIEFRTQESLAGNAKKGGCPLWNGYARDGTADVLQNVLT
jgi:hypothetical protein